MRRIWGVVLLLVCLVSCQSAEDAEPGNSETFIKLIGSEFQDSPSQFLTITDVAGNDDGLLILGTTTNESLNNSRIRLTRTDRKGNTVWERIYPSADSANFSYVASSMIAVNDGYFIVGDSIRNEIDDDEGEEEVEIFSGSLIMKVDLNGDLVQNMLKTTTIEDADLRGRGVLLSRNGELIVLSEIQSDSPEDILVSTLDVNNLQELCLRRYSDTGEDGTFGDISLTSSLIQEPTGNYVFTGIINKSGRQNGITYVIPQECNDLTISAPLLVSASDGNNYKVSQITSTINGFAVVGTTDGEGIKTDIFFALLDNVGALQNTLVTYSQLDGKEATDEEEGLTIAPTDDGGFIIGGSTRSNTDAGETNIIIIKIDRNGNIQWTNQFGDLNEEEAIFIKQATDGGFYILGETEFGGLDTMIVIRTDENGKVE